MGSRSVLPAVGGDLEQRLCVYAVATDLGRGRPSKHKN